MATVDVDGRHDCGWWEPGNGEPGEDWEFTPARLRLAWDGPGESSDVQVMTPGGPRALVAVPIEGIAQVMAQQTTEDTRED